MKAKLQQLLVSTSAHGAAAWNAALRVPARTRIRLAVAVLAVWLVGSAALGWSAVNAASEAEGQVRRLAGTVQGLELRDLSDPVAFSRVAEAADEATRSLAGVRLRLAPLRPAELLPLAGPRLREARHTAEVGEEVSRSVHALAGFYGELLEGRRNGAGMTAADAMEPHRGRLRDAQRGLATAARLTERPLSLSDRDAAVVAVGVPALQALIELTLESHDAASAVAGLLATTERLGRFSTDPFELLGDADSVASEALALREHAAIIAAESRLLAERPGAPSKGLGLMAAAASSLSAAGRTGEGLTRLALAAEKGFLSEDFAAEAGPLLEEALESSRSAGAHMAAVREIVAELAARSPAGSDEIVELVDGWIQSGAEDIAWLETAVAAMHSMLGFDGPKTYLAVMQNHNEIRATGGFLGVTVELHVANGVLTDMVYEDSTDLDAPPLIDNPAAPEPLYWYLWMGRLLFRDANWSPDFPESASTLKDMYLKARGVEVDGVVAGTKFLAWDLVDALGDVRVPHVDRVLTRELTIQYTEGELPYPCLDHHASGRDKRCFDQDLTQALVDQVRSGITPEQRASLLALIQGHLDRSNILLSMDEPSAAAFIAKQRWDGAVRTPSQDFLMVVDSSFPGHIAAHVTRTWDYRVHLRPGVASNAELRLRYENAHPPEGGVCRQADHDAGACYWNYVRVLLPPAAEGVRLPPVALHEGSEMLAWGYPDTDSSSVLSFADGPLRGLTEAGAYLTVEPSSVLTLPISYELSPGVLQELPQGRYRYRLSLAKQPGMDRDVVNVRVVLPAGARVIEASPAGAVQGRGGVSWQFVLERDTDLMVVFE